MAITRAIATDPEVLLLDEITSALDPELVGEVLDLVRSLAEGRATILMATHEMAFAQGVADRVAFLDEGRDRRGRPAGKLFGAPERARTRAHSSRASPPEAPRPSAGVARLTSASSAECHELRRHRGILVRSTPRSAEFVLRRTRDGPDAAR
ncbi:MAG: AAA family ATPase [Microbacterium sp.]